MTHGGTQAVVRRGMLTTPSLHPNIPLHTVDAPQSPCPPLPPLRSQEIFDSCCGNELNLTFGTVLKSNDRIPVSWGYKAKYPALHSHTLRSTGRFLAAPCFRARHRNARPDRQQRMWGR